MKTMKKIVSVIAMIVIIMGVLTLTGCGKKDKNESKSSIVGVWKVESEENYDFRYVFNDDGTGYYAYMENQLPFTYEDKGDKVVIVYSGNPIESEIEYRIEGNTLIIKNEFGKEIKYNKQ